MEKFNVINIIIKWEGNWFDDMKWLFKLKCFIEYMEIFLQSNHSKHFLEIEKLQNYGECELSKWRGKNNKCSIFYQFIRLQFCNVNVRFVSYFGFQILSLWVITAVLHKRKCTCLSFRNNFSYLFSLHFTCFFLVLSPL